jgi:hypothetical protein
VFECAVANRASRAATKVEDEENKVFWERMVPLALMTDRVLSIPRAPFAQDIELSDIITGQRLYVCKGDIRRK